VLQNEELDTERILNWKTFRVFFILTKLKHFSKISQTIDRDNRVTSYGKGDFNYE